MKKTLEYLLIVIIIGVLIAGMCILFEKVGIIPQNKVLHQDWEFCEDSICTDCDIDTLSVEDVIKFREALREDAIADSIFMAIPEPILRYILENYGTELSNIEIMEVYNANKPFFDGLLEGKETTEEIFNKKVDNLKHKIDSLKKLKEDEKAKTNLRECRAPNSKRVRNALVSRIEN